MIDTTPKRPLGRSRTGCITCRIRKVKCDEEKPSCQRCRSSGRQCDGYSTSGQSSPSGIAAGHNMRIVQYTPQFSNNVQTWAFSYPKESLTERGYESWEFFYAQSLSCFDRRTRYFLLRAAYHDSDIRSAAMALGSLHRIFVSKSGAAPCYGRDRDIAVSQYNLAIRRGLKQLSLSSGDSVNVILTMCVLFFCFESLQGHFQAALRHLASGLRIVQSQPSSKPYQPPRVIRSVLTRMETQMLELDGGLFLPTNLRPKVSATFGTSPLLPSNPATLEDITTAFESLCNRFMRLVYLSQDIRAERCDIPAEQISTEGSRIHAMVNQWSVVFDNFLDTHPEAEQESESRNTTLALQMWRVALKIIFDVGFTPGECEWDRHLSGFATIVSLAEQIIGRSSEQPSSANRTDIKEEREVQGTGSKMGTSYSRILPRIQTPSTPSFSLTLGILPILWAMSTNCRDSRIRYRMIDLMARSRRQEGIWDSQLYAKVATRVARLEEEAAGLREGVDYGPEDIPEAARVRVIMGIFGEGRRGEVRYFSDAAGVVEERLCW